MWEPTLASAHFQQSHLFTTHAAQHPASNITVFFSCSLISQEHFPLGTWVSSASWLAKMPSRKRQEWEAEPAGPEVTDHITETQKHRLPTPGEMHMSGANSVGPTVQEYALYDLHAFLYGCTSSNKCTFHPTLITLRYLVVESRWPDLNSTWYIARDKSNRTPVNSIP